MSQDVGPVKGPSGAPEPLSGTGKKEKSPSGEFKKIMKVEKAREVDPEEKRKRRERTEKEEEPEDEPTTTPKELVTPFSVEEKEMKISPLEMQTPLSKPSPMQAAPSSSPPAEEELTDPASSEPISQQTAPSQTSSPSSPSSSEESTPSSRLQPEQTQSTPHRPSETPQQAQQKEEDQILFPEAPPPSLEEEKEVFFKEFTANQQEAKKLQSQKEEVEMNPLLTTPPPLTPSSAIEKEEMKELKIESSSSQIPEGAASPTSILPSIEAPSAPLPPYTFLPPQMLDLFERMVGTMSIMSTEGITETTIDLTSDQFASSIFFGSQIIIKEYATAPNQFNIQFNTTPQGANMFQANVDDLLAAFQGGNYAFRVLRCETHILSERPLFKRKEATGDQGSKQQGQE